MNEATTPSAAESDPSLELLDDPFLFGLDTPASGATPAAPDPVEEARLAAARAMLQQIESQSERASRAPAAPSATLVDLWEQAPQPESVPVLEPEFTPETLPEWGPAECPTPPDEAVAAPIPDGAILAANGQPFRDPDAARFKAARLSEETGEPFEVLAIVGGFVLVHSAAAETPRPAPPPIATPAAPPVAPPRKSAAAGDAPNLDHLTIDNFPEGHPARKYGLPLYKAILSQTRKPLRQAWRSQLPLLIVALIGLLVFAAPQVVVSLAVPPGSAERLAGPAFKQGVGYAGLALALFVLGKMIFIRINYRYFLTANYAKSEAGIIARRATKLVYGTILATDTHQSVLGRLLNFGTVELSCAGSDGNEILIENVYAPEIVQAVIESRMIEMRGGTYYR